MGKKLVDFSLTGREKKWHEKKISARDMADSFRRLGKYMQADSMYGCGDTLIFDSCPEGHYNKIKRAFFCKVRMCPYCAWRRSQKVADEVMKVASLVEQTKKVKWLFLTLTIRNCKKEELQDTITKMMQAFNKLNQRTVFKKYVLGWFRGLEVTRNNEVVRKDMEDNEWYDTYHPHFHVLLAVSNTYFKNGYLNKDEWQQLWGDCLKVDYTPIVDIQRVKDKKRKKENEIDDFEKNGFFDVSPIGEVPAGIIAEVTKYTLKSNEVFNDWNPVTLEEVPLTTEEIDDIVIHLFGALSKRRLYAFGGLLKEMAKELKIAELDDLDPDELDDIEHDKKCNCPVCNTTMKETLYSWIPKYNNYYSIEDQRLRDKIMNHEYKKNNPKEGRVKRRYVTGHVDDERD